MSTTATKNTTKVIDKENQEAWEISRENPTLCLKSAKKTLEKAIENDYTKGIAWATGNIGAAHIWLSNYEEALENTNKAQELLNVLKEFKQETEILYNLSVIFYFLGDYDRQLHYAYESLNLSNKIDYLSGKANALNAIGLVHYSQDKNEEAIKFLEEGKVIAKEINNTAILGKLLDGLGQAYFNLGDYKKAIWYKNECLSVVSIIGESYAHDGIGQIYLKKNDFINAFIHFKKALRVRQQLKFKSGEAETIMHIGETHLASNNITSAVEWINKAIYLAHEINAHEIVSQSHFMLSEHYEKVNDLASYVEHYKAYHEAREIYNKEKESKKIKTFELKGRLEQMKVEKELLEEKNNQLKNYFKDVQTLSQIGNEITSSLDFESIFNVIYERINSLMDAQGIFIGIYNEEKEKIEVRLALNHGKRDSYFEYSMEDNNKLPVLVVKNKQEIHINDYQKEISDYIKNEEVRHNAPESLIILPLMVKENVKGVLLVQSENKNAFSTHHYNILKSFANYSAIALDNASLYEVMEEKVKARTAELEQNYKNTELLSKIGQELISTLDFGSVTERLYKNVNKLMDANIFGVRLFDEEKQEINYKHDYEDGNKYDEMIVSMDDDDNYSVWCIKNNKEIFINDNKTEYINYVKKVVVVSGEFPLSVIFYPLRKGNKVIGLITVQSLEKNAYTKYHLNILKSLANYTVIALNNARNYEIMEAEVEKRTQELVLQKEIIEEKNKHITDSIHYAKRIQDATLPDLGLMKKYLENSFVLFKPKDIVSGDFYWIEKKGDEIIFAVVDCTGHGVPGAFLSLIGHNSLNQIVNELHITQPSQILEELNKSVYKALQNDLAEGHIQDGMDMSICSLNIKTNVLQFAGAYNPMYLVRDEAIQEVKGDKVFIGSGNESNDKKFQNTTIQLEKDDCIYLFSDGYADQFGGPKGKKFKYSRFKELLLNINNMDMEEQHHNLDATIKKWQGDLEQIDDVCIIGIKAS